MFFRPVKQEAPPTGPVLAPGIVNPSEGAELLYKLQQHARPDSCVVQFVACHAGDGSSTLARDLALIAAGLGQRVLLLDLDQGGDRQLKWLRSHWAAAPSFHAWEPAPSLSINDTVLCVPAGMRILQAGSSGLHVSELTADWTPTQAHCASLFQMLRDRFDVVLVDSKPISQSADALLLAQHVRTSVLVVAAESTRLKVIEDLRSRIAEVGGDIAGIALNRRRFHIPRWIYDWL